MRTIITFLVCITVSNTCFAEVHHVPADFPTIQYAVDAAVDGDEIIVAPGTYTSTDDEVVDMRGKEIWLHSSGGADVTIIDGEDSRRVINCTNDETPNTIIEGFKITRGTHEHSGAGINCNSSNPSIKSCIFENNHAMQYGGGGINLQSCDEGLSIEDCIFKNNTATITNNWEYGGGGIALYSSSPIILNCIFEGNQSSEHGGAIFSRYSGSPIITNCTFNENVSQKTGGAISTTEYQATNFGITGCTFISNTTSGDGGGIYCFQSTIFDCKFMQNSATENGGGVFSGGNTSKGSPTISTTDFCENNPDPIYGNWVNKGGNEFLNDCGDVEGACCVKDACYEVELIFCESINGEWLGYNATCEEDSCTDPPQYGACCINGEAIPLFDYDCDRILGTFMGEGTNPDDVTCPVHCAEDVTGDGVVDVSDLLAIIAVWGACP